VFPSLENELRIVIMSSIGCPDINSLYILSISSSSSYPKLDWTYRILHTILIRPLGDRLDIAQSLLLSRTALWTIFLDKLLGL
jgi:hypothetical protein